MGKEKRQQRKEREESIRESKYNKWYKEIVKEEIPVYLREGTKEKNGEK